jgi:hypothetical protein
MPGCMASSTSRTFSATDQRRRRCTEVMTSTRRNGSSELLDLRRHSQAHAYALSAMPPVRSKLGALHRANGHGSQARTADGRKGQSLACPDLPH